MSLLPKNLKYGNRVESAPARAYKTNLQPQNGTGNYGLSDQITINIPTRNNLVLVPTESYLKFNLVVNNTSAGASTYRWGACGAHSLIQRIRIFHGSNLISDIDSYNVLANFLFDVSVPYDSTMGKQNILAGTRSNTSFKIPGAYAADSIWTIENVNSGDIIGNAIAAGASSTKKTYCLNLISLVGTLSNQYIPLFAMSSAPLRVEIILQDSIVKAMCSSTNTSTITVSNCEYVANFIELNDQAVSMVYASLGGSPLQYVISDYRNYQYNFTFLNGTAQSLNIPIPAKFSSLKSIYCAVRDKGTGLATFFPCSSVNKGIVDFVFRIGSQILPSKAPNTLPEHFAELLKAVGSMSDNSHQPAIEFKSFSLLDSVANGHTDATIGAGAYYIGIDLESYANSDKNSGLFQGYNSNTDEIYLVINTDGTGANDTVRFDCYALYDSVLICEHNTAYVKF